MPFVTATDSERSPVHRAEARGADHQPVIRHRLGPALPGDPLAYAVERAWQAGIVVVVAAGNDGGAHPGLAAPANDPYVAVRAEVSDQGVKVPHW